MSGCSDTRVQIAFYLDDELHGSERAAIAAHLKNCAGCRGFFEAQRAFLTAIHNTRPLYVAPSELRARVTHIVSDAPSPHQAPDELRRRLQRFIRSFTRR